MALRRKYQPLIDIAVASGITDLKISEHSNVLYISGTAPNGDVKNKLWDVYNQLDPNFISADLILDIDLSPNVSGIQAKVITESTNLNLRKGPGIEQLILGTVAKDEIILLIGRASSQWWLVRTADGREGYCYAQYIQPLV